MMPRYIDADALVKELERYDDYAIDIVNDQPTADAVEVVRCKDCKHRKGTFRADRRWKEGGYWIYWCELDTGDPFELGRNAEDDDWFCADGERRTEDAEQL